jgi:hypothetical protein
MISFQNIYYMMATDSDAVNFLKTKDGNETLEISPLELTQKDSNNANKEDDIPFWSTNPNVIFNKEHILEFFPVEDMTFTQKLNAVTRVIILMTIITFAYTRKLQILVVGAISIFFIYMLHQYKSKPAEEAEETEGFDLSGPAGDLVEIKLGGAGINNVFQKPSPNNPLGNVLVTDYIYNPKRKPAPPAYNESVAADIVVQAKQMVKNANPGNADLADKLFKDLGDEYVFEQSLQPFYSTASTTIPNDQESFSEFCYGSMISCKEGNAFACAKNNATKYNNY